MTNSKIISPAALTIFLLIFSLSTIGTPSQALAATVAGSVSALNGTVTIVRGTTTISAADGVAVNVGDRIVTAAGSSATITLTDGSQIEVTDSSNMTIDENALNLDGTRASTKVSLLSGMVRSLVRSTPGKPPNFEVHTPNAVASARGTSFDVDYHKD